MNKCDVDYKQILNSAHLHATDERLFVVELLHRALKPQTSKEIFKKCKNLKIHETTLYRMLASFKESGLVKQIDFGGKLPYFELADMEHDHHHIVCTHCKKVSDFTGCDIDKVVKKALAQSKEFKTITNHSFELFGLCKKCA